MRIIHLTKGVNTLIDDEDYEFLLYMGSWCAVQKPSGTWYAFHTNKLTRKSEYMHRTIMERIYPNFQGEVDHIDGNGLNNQRSNLRIATRSQNLANQRSRGGISKYKGVVWNRSAQKWQSQIRCQGILSYLGCFDYEIEAAKAYDRAAICQFGEFARLNFERS